MKQHCIRIGVVLMLCLSFTSVYAQSILVLEDVNVITMEDDHVLENQSVVIRNGVIEQIDRSERVRVPPGAQVIDALGKFLLPGFINMYTHVSRESLILYLANGQLTVRDTPSHIAVLGLRDDVRSGRLSGPRIFSIGLRATGMPAPYHSQQPAVTPEEGRAQVREAIRLGYDGIMIYATCSPATYDAILDEAGKHDFPVSGHWPMYVERDKAVSLSQATFDNFSGLTRDGELRVDEEFLFEGLKRNRKAVVPTLSIHKLWAMDHLDARIYRELPLQYVPTKLKASWIPDGDPAEPGGYNYENVERLVKRMHDEGIQLFTGSDGGYPMAVQGFSFHNELQAFVDAGIPEYHTLKYATVDAARYLKLDKTGLVKEGYAADLVLLGGNPLEEIANTRRMEGVVLGGEWLGKEYFEEELEALATRLASRRNRFEHWEEYLAPEEETEEYHYSYRSHGQEIGEEKILVDSSQNGEIAVRSVSVVDGPDFRESRSFFRIRGRQLDSLAVVVRGADGRSTITAYKKGNSVLIEGEAPFHGSFVYEEPFLPGMLLLAPFTSRYFDMDVVANYQIGLMLGKSLDPGEADQLPSVQIEMNSEEFGRKYIVDTFDLTVFRNDDMDDIRQYTFIHPGFSGFRSLTQSSFVLQAEVEDRIIQKIAFGNYVVELIRQDGTNFDRR